MSFKVDVKLNPDVIRQLQEGARKAFPLTMEAFKSEVELAQVIPREHGDLMGSGFITYQDDKAFLSYSAIYARRLYFHPEYNFRTDRHSNARGRWLDDWIYGAKKDWLSDTFLKFWKANAGGVIK